MLPLACCSDPYLTAVAESQSSGRLRRPYHLEPFTYFGGTAQEVAGKIKGDGRGEGDGYEAGWWAMLP